MRAGPVVLATPVVVAVLVLLASPVAARTESVDPAKPTLVQQLVDCRAIAADADRLACFDRQVAALDAATQSREIVFADKAEMKKARSGLFGFRLPSLNIFGHGKEDDQELTEIDSTVSTARRSRTGEWRIVLADGAVWEQVSTDQLVFDPRPGNTVHIKQGALGSYRVTIDNQPSIKMHRVE